MTQYYSKLELKERRRQLRLNMTKAEKILLNHLNRKQIQGCRFLRQFSIENFIVDFFCPALNLAIEIDGSSHLTPKEIEYDSDRQEGLESLKITFLRFINDEVYFDLDNVVKDIELKVSQLKKNPPAPLS